MCLADSGARQTWHLCKKLVARCWSKVTGTSRPASAATGSLSISGMLSTGSLAPCSTAAISRARDAGGGRMRGVAAQVKGEMAGKMTARCLVLSVK